MSDPLANYSGPTVGGSMVARICRDRHERSLSPWGGRLSAYYELVDKVGLPDSPTLSRGRALEPWGLKAWAAREGIEHIYEPGAIKAPGLPYAHATLDAWAIQPGVGEGVVEVKTLAREHMGDEWGEDGSDRVLPAYHLQALWYMGVALAGGLPQAARAAMPVLVGHSRDLEVAAHLARTERLMLEDFEPLGLELRVYHVAWDYDLFRAVDAQVRRFLVDHVVPRVPPEPDAADVLLSRDMDAVARGQPKPGPDAVPLDYERLGPVQQALVREWLEAYRGMTGWGAMEEQHRARLQLMLGGAPGLVGLPGGGRIDWKCTKSGTRPWKPKVPEETRG